MRLRQNSPPPLPQRFSNQPPKLIINVLRIHLLLKIIILINLQFHYLSDPVKKKIKKNRSLTSERIVDLADRSGDLIPAVAYKVQNFTHDIKHIHIKLRHTLMSYFL